MSGATMYIVPIAGLYPTFKEWKLVFRYNYISDPNYVYILPLRNENSIGDPYLLENLLVYILPLRNENNRKRHYGGKGVLFISYL